MTLRKPYVQHASPGGKITALQAGDQIDVPVATATTKGFLSSADFNLIHGVKEMWFPCSDYDGNALSYRVQNVGSGGSQRFTFDFPADFTSITRLNFVLTSTSTGIKSYDLISAYGTVGELNNNHTSTLLAQSINVLAVDTFMRLDISGVFPLAAAQDFAGILLNRAASGGTFQVYGLELEYT